MFISPLLCRYGGKQVLLTSMLLASVLTGLTPILARIGLPWLIAIRAALGFFSGVLYPTVMALFGKWVT